MQFRFLAALGVLIFAVILCASCAEKEPGAGKQIRVGGQMNIGIGTAGTF